MRFFYKIITIICCIFFSATIVMAGDNTDNMRGIYDVVMRWVNFLILAGIIVKYGKAPLINFLNSQKKETELKIQTLEEEKKLALHKIDEIKITIDNSQSKMEEFKNKIRIQGEREKNKIIQDANDHVKIVHEGTQKRIDQMIMEAKQNFKEELLDSAIDMASQKLPDVISDDDNEKFFDQYITNTRMLNVESR